MPPQLGTRLRAPRTTAAQRTAYLAAFARSDLSTAAFCREQGLVPATFASWQSAARQRPTRRRPAAAPRFAQVVVAGASSTSSSSIHVALHTPAGEATITGVDPETLVRVVRAWARASRLPRA